MNYTTLTFVIIAILLLDFLVEHTLSFLNAKYAKTELPEELSDVYDKNEYARQQMYLRANKQFAHVSGAFSFLLILAMILFGGFAIVGQWADSVAANPILVSLIFFGVIFLANDLISTPFDWYDHFVIEERFGFNKMTLKTFFSDKFKGLVLMAIVGGLILAIIEWIYFSVGSGFWFYAWIIMAAFSIFMNMFYAQLIVPIFNKLTPLEEGELRDAIEKFGKEAGFQLDNIFVMDGSKRSTKANAYFSGLGAKKRIVLYDTLINELTTDEIVAVLAHEVGHYKHKHTFCFLVLSLLNSLIMLSLLGQVLDNDALAQALGMNEASFHVNMLVFGLLFTPVSVFIGVIINIISRRFEYQADRFAKEHGLGDELISALKKISAKALSNLQPHPAYVFFYYSHPTLLQRIRAIKN